MLSDLSPTQLLTPSLVTIAVGICTPRASGVVEVVGAVFLYSAHWFIQKA